MDQSGLTAIINNELASMARQLMQTGKRENKKKKKKESWLIFVLFTFDRDLSPEK